jgi:hypothetical protein
MSLADVQGSEHLAKTTIRGVCLHSIGKAQGVLPANSAVARLAPTIRTQRSPVGESVVGVSKVKGANGDSAMKAFSKQKD